MSNKVGPVLLAIDGSDCAEYTFNWYFEHLHKKHAAVTLLHASVPPVMFGGQAQLTASVYATLLARDKERLTLLQEKYAKLLKAKHASAKIKLVIGANPGEVIADTAQELGASMVIMGCRGLGTVRRTVLGSVSDYVLHHAHCPVFICKLPGEKTTGADPSLAKPGAYMTF